MHRWLLVAGLIAAAQAAEARVKLVALPDRDRVVVSLAHPDAVLVEEERVVALQEGLNRVDFSWQGVAIDGDSIQVHALDAPDAVRVLNTSYPPGENALIWEIASPSAREERFRISYLIAGLRREHVYKAVAASGEQALALRTYLRLDNQSGEDLEQASFTLPDGTSLERSLRSGEIVELQVDRADPVAVVKELRWDARAQPWEPEFADQTPGTPLAYVVKNDKASGLGREAIRPGKARIFLATQERGDDGAPAGEGVAFLGEDNVPLTPADRELRLNLGESRDVKVTQKQLKNDRTHIQRNKNNQDVLWDTDEAFSVEVQNFKKEPVHLVLVQHVPEGAWKMVEHSHAFEKKDAYTLEFPLVLKPESKQLVQFAYQRLNVQPNSPQPVQRRIR